MLSIDEMIERETRHIATHVAEGSKFIRLRGRIRILRPYDIDFLKGQTNVHNVFMKDGHTWQPNLSDPNLRKCSVCCKSQRLSKDGIWENGLANTSLTQEDVTELIVRSSRWDGYLASKDREPKNTMSDDDGNGY